MIFLKKFLNIDKVFFYWIDLVDEFGVKMFYLWGPYQMLYIFSLFSCRICLQYLQLAVFYAVEITFTFTHVSSLFRNGTWKIVGLAVWLHQELLSKIKPEFCMFSVKIYLLVPL